MQVKPGCRVIAAALSMLVCSYSPAVWADSASPPESAVCMVSQSGEDGTESLNIIVPSSQAGSFGERGFVPMPCPDDPAVLASYRASICELAQNAPEGVLAQFLDTWKVTPQELCAAVGGN